MNKWKKILLVFGSLALVAVACFLSWSYGFRSGMHAGGITREMAELGVFYGHMEEQMTNADCEGTKQAITDYLMMLEKYKDVKGGLITTDTSYYGDVMLSHIRLARIEKKLGNKTEAEKHVQLAKEACAYRKWQDCSEDKIIWFAKRIEEQHPIACLSYENKNAQQ